MASFALFRSTCVSNLSNQFPQKYYRKFWPKVSPINWTKAGELTLSLLPFDPFLATLLSSACQGSWPLSVISRLLGLLASCWVCLMDGREKPEYFSATPLPIWVAVAVSLLWPRIPEGPTVASASGRWLVPGVWKYVLLLWSPAFSLGSRGSDFQPLLISGCLSIPI